MTLQEKLNKAEELYHTKGKNYEAIELYSIILEEHDEISNAWFNLASLKFQIADFDGCFKAFFNAQKLEPDNNWFHHMYVTWLSLISSFDYKEPYFFDNNTKEAHTIKTFCDKTEVLKTLIEELNLSLKYKSKGDRDFYNTVFKLGMKNREIGNIKDSVKFFKEALNSIPEKFNTERTIRQKRLIYLNTAIAFKNAKEWEKAKQNILLAKELGLDDFHSELVKEILMNAN